MLTHILHRSIWPLSLVQGKDCQVVSYQPSEVLELVGILCGTLKLREQIPCWGKTACYISSTRDQVEA